MRGLRAGDEGREARADRAAEEAEAERNMTQDQKDSDGQVYLDVVRLLSFILIPTTATSALEREETKSADSKARHTAEA